MIATVTDNFGNVLSASHNVRIALIDANDSPPVFAADSLETITIDENSVFPETTFTATAQIDNVVYSLSGADARFFTIDEDSGTLTARADTVFDYESKTSYSLGIVATADAFSATHNLLVTITNVNDVAPIFASNTPSTITFAEDASFPATTFSATGDVGTVAYSLTGTDADDFVFTLSDDRFEIIGDEVRVKENASFDVEVRTDITVTITATKTETINNGTTTSTSVTTLTLDFTVTILAPEYEFADLPSVNLNYSDENDTITGTTANEIIQGGDGDDTITSGGGRDVIIGGRGDDTITLGDGAQSVVYRFTSGSDALSWSFEDGADTVRDFKVGEDSLLLVEQNCDGVHSLSSLLTAIADTLPANTVQFVFTKDGDSYTEFAIQIAGTEDGVTFVLDEAIEGTLATTITAATGSDGALDITSTSAQSIIAQLFTATGSVDAIDLLDVTMDTTPSGIDIF